MFLHLLPSTEALFSVVFSEYSKRYFCKAFEKKYKGKIWELTKAAIVVDLSRIDRKLQRTQQVDELNHKGDCWLFKYDFSVVKSGVSPKASGNRCVAFLDTGRNQVEILFIYGKGDLPKNMGEQAFIEKTLREEFSDMLAKCR
jgi:hypothetical protein